jgi:hypothetical protein
MTTALAQRKYRLTGRLLADTAKTFGLGMVLAFAFAVIASVVYREATGMYVEFVVYVLLLLPLVMVAAGWAHTSRTYPVALANGVTRKEFLAALAIYGIVLIAATAAFTQLANLVIDLGSTFRGVEYHEGYYGSGLWASIVRPALYLAVGAAGGALTHRFASRRIGFALGVLVVAVVAYRQTWLQVPIERLTQDGPLAALGVEDFAAVDAVLAALLALLTWVLLSRASKRPKEI